MCEDGTFGGVSHRKPQIGASLEPYPDYGFPETILWLSNKPGHGLVTFHQIAPRQRRRLPLKTSAR